MAVVQRRDDGSWELCVGSADRRKGVHEIFRFGDC